MKKILVTGGSRGIGFAIAKRFHQEGFEVIICAKSQEGLDKAKEQIPDLQCYQCDVSDKTAVKALGETLRAQHGAFDVLVNNAGTFQPGLLLEEEDSVFETMMTTNLNSAYYLTKALVPDMVERKEGTIINMCSVASLDAYPNGGSYSISKFALLGYSKNLRSELKDKGVRVLSIMPGPVWTDSWIGAGFEPERLASVEDIAEITYTSCILSKRTVIEDIVVRPQLGDI